MGAATAWLLPWCIHEGRLDLARMRELADRPLRETCWLLRCEQVAQARRAAFHEWVDAQRGEG